MNKPLPCGVCGLPLERHTIELFDGVAHAVFIERERERLAELERRWCERLNRVLRAAQKEREP